MDKVFVAISFLFFIFYFFFQITIAESGIWNFNLSALSLNLAS